MVVSVTPGTVPTAPGHPYPCPEHVKPPVPGQLAVVRLARMSRTLVSSAAVLLAVTLLAGCGDDGPAATAEPTGSSSQAEEPTQDPSTDPSAEPTEPEAADERLQVSAGSLALPDGWEVDRSDRALASSPSGASVLTIGDLGAVGPTTVKQLGRALETGAGAEAPELGFDVRLDGEPGFAVRETDLRDEVAHYLFGSIKDGRAVQVLFTLSSQDLAPREHAAFLDEVLASYAWR